MGDCFSTNLVPFYSQLFALTRLTQGATYSAYYSNGDTTCSGAGPNDKCVFHCDEKDTKESEAYSFNCGIVANCEIRCEEKKCFENGQINARFVSGDLNVIASGDQCLKLAEIDAPNYGSAYLSESHKSFRSMTVNSGTNTQNIIIDCTNGSGDECKGLQVNAASAQYLEISVGAASELYGDGVASNIYCPQNSNYNGAESASCVIDLSAGGTLYWVDIHASNGIPQDVIIKEGAVIMSYVQIICNDGISMNNGNSFSTSSACWNVATANPTIKPTAKTTIKPTIKPTANPTLKPTAKPTLTPTTATPTTAKPTPLIPTAPTTKAPSSSTTKQPTKSPTKSITTTTTTTSNPTQSTTTVSVNTPSRSPVSIDTCFTSCSSQIFNPIKCKALNVGILCHDTNNECHARCVIEREIEEAKLRYANDSSAIAAYTQLSGTSTDEAFIAYCSSGYCSDTTTNAPITAPFLYTTASASDELVVNRNNNNNSDAVMVGLGAGGIIGLIIACIAFILCCCCCIKLWRKYQRKLIEPKGNEENNLRSLEDEILSGHFELKGNKLVELKGAGTRWDQYQIDEDKEIASTTDMDYGLKAPPPKMRQQQEEEESIAKAAKHNVVQLESLAIASCVATPCGCLLCFCGIYIVLTLFGIYMVLFPVCLSFNFSDFKVINSAISNEQYQFVLAQETAYDVLGDNSISISDNSRRRRRSLLYEKYGKTLYTKDDYLYRAIAADSLTVFYYAKQGANVLRNNELELIHLIEKGIKSYSGYSNHSLLYDVQDTKLKAIFGFSYRQLFLEAAPGSFLNYLYPSSIVGNKIYDGNGDKLTLVNGDLEETIRSLDRQYASSGMDITDFFDFSFNFFNVSSKYLAAVYPFSYHGAEEYKNPLKLYNWVASYKAQLFDTLPPLITSYIGVAVVDSRLLILNDELYYYLSQDFKLAIASLIIIYVVLYLYCRSFYITSFGIFGVCASFIPCFAIFQMIYGDSFNIVNLVSVWVILGIGCDDICVFISSYRRAPLESVSGEVIPNHLRLAFAYREAGAAMFVTSFTTSFSFFSLCLSTINPLPQFGWFLASLVLTNFILVMTWFPIILQSYVWFVMGAIEYNCHINQCTKWLAVAVPLPPTEAVDLNTNNTKNNNLQAPNNNNNNNKRNSSIWQRESVMAVLSENRLYAHDVDKRYRQQSKMFAVPSAQSRISAFVELNELQEESKADWRRKSVKTIANKLDETYSSSGFQAETKFGDCTNLYFILMRRGLGIALIVLLIILTITFCITATQIQLAQETAVLLPENTNWGRVNTAFKYLNIDVDQYSGYSSTSGASSGSIVVSTNSVRPTSAPVTSVAPTTAYPTKSTTLSPTLSPTTAYPTLDPTSAQPTTPFPTHEPTVSNAPTMRPTMRPTYVAPQNPQYKCTNDGYNIICKVEEFSDGTLLQKQQIALVFEAGGLYNAAAAYNISWQDDIIACPYFNNISSFYEEDAYISPHGYDVKWCFFSASPIPTSKVQFEYKTPYSSLMTTSWYRLSLWLYFNSQWNHIQNKKGDYWYNYSLDVFGFGSNDANILSVDEAVTINLLFGTDSATELSTNCDGEVIDGQLTFDPLFNIYSAQAQQRWNQLCDELKNINDPILYRTDFDQDLCFAFAFNEYLSNSSNGAHARMPNANTTNVAKFNGYLLLFISQPTSASFSDALLFDARIFRNWFGTETSASFEVNTSRITWLQQTVRTQINKHLGGPQMWNYYLSWDRWMHNFNKNSPKSFQGIQTSPTYMRMEVEVAFLNGFIQSVAYTILLCSLVMIFFTQNLYLVLLVCLYILLICIFVVGIFGAFGWPFGIIEVISVPTVVGLTIDYALHITHAYIHSPFPDRASRSKSAVNDLGSSVFASAMTTISSMFILYFAAIIIFSDLGWVVATTTMFGVALALLVCPPCLMYTGPEYNQCHLTWFLCCCTQINGCTFRGYTFCANKWHGINKDNDPTLTTTTDTASATDITSLPQQDIELAVGGNSYSMTQSGMMQNNPLQYNIQVTQEEEDDSDSDSDDDTFV